MFTQNLAGYGGVGKQTNGIVGDVQIANIDLNHFLNTDLTKWLKRKNFSSFFLLQSSVDKNRFVITYPNNRRKRRSVGAWARHSEL